MTRFPRYRAISDPAFASPFCFASLPRGEEVRAEEGVWIAEDGEAGEVWAEDVAEGDAEFKSSRTLRNDKKNSPRSILSRRFVFLFSWYLSCNTIQTRSLRSREMKETSR